MWLRFSRGPVDFPLYYGHALTCWGYNYTDLNGVIQYTGVYFTDSDDEVTQLQYYEVNWNSGLYYLEGYAGNGWFIGGGEAPAQNLVPLSPTLLLFGSGLLALVRGEGLGEINYSVP